MAVSGVARGLRPEAPVKSLFFLDLGIRSRMMDRRRGHPGPSAISSGMSVQFAAVPVGQPHPCWRRADRL